MKRQFRKSPLGIIGANILRWCWTVLVPFLGFIALLYLFWMSLST